MPDITHVKHPHNIQTTGSLNPCTQGQDNMLQPQDTLKFGQQQETKTRVILKAVEIEKRQDDELLNYNPNRTRTL